MFMVNVNAETCDGCEECVTICPNEVFQLADGKSIPDANVVVAQITRTSPLLNNPSTSLRALPPSPAWWYAIPS